MQMLDAIESNYLVQFFIFAFWVHLFEEMSQSTVSAI